MNLADIVNYYVERLPIQFRGLPKARATIAILAKQAIGDDILNQLAAAFDLDTATGKQLDIIGKYVGVSRNIGVPNPQGYFGLWSYNSTLDYTDYQGTWDPTQNIPALPAASSMPNKWYAVTVSGDSTAPIAQSWLVGQVIKSDGVNWSQVTNENTAGLTTYNDPSINSNGIFLSYWTSSRQATALTDASYRSIIKLKIATNASRTSLADIDAILDTLFGNLIKVTDLANMHATYTVVSTVALSKDILLAFLPRPMGVAIDVLIVNPPSGGGDRILTEPGGDVLTTEGGDTLVTESP